jgi:hypothetical protein
MNNTSNECIFAQQPEGGLQQARDAMLAQVPGTCQFRTIAHPERTVDNSNEKE